MKFYLATTLRNGRVDLLPHWVDYYLQLGVDRILVCVYCEGMEDRMGEIRSHIVGKPVEIRCFNDWTDGGQEAAMRAALDEIGCAPGDWRIHADVDELNEFPCPIQYCPVKFDC